MCVCVCVRGGVQNEKKKTERDNVVCRRNESKEIKCTATTMIKTLRLNSKKITSLRQLTSTRPRITSKIRESRRKTVRESLVLRGKFFEQGSKRNSPLPQDLPASPNPPKCRASIPCPSHDRGAAECAGGSRKLINFKAILARIRKEGKT